MAKFAYLSGCTSMCCFPFCYAFLSLDVSHDFGIEDLSIHGFLYTELVSLYLAPSVFSFQGYDGLQMILSSLKSRNGFVE